MAYIILYVDGKEEKVLDREIADIVRKMIINRVCKVDIIHTSEKTVTFITTEKEVK